MTILELFSPSLTFHRLARRLRALVAGLPAIGARPYPVVLLEDSAEGGLRSVAALLADPFGGEVFPGQQARGEFHAQAGDQLQRSQAAELGELAGEGGAG